MHYLQHAWDNTNSVWGKACIVLFYLFVWFNVIWGAMLVVNPTMGAECFYGAKTSSAYDVFMMKYMMRTINLFTVGFCLYADRGGIKFWNVLMFAIVYALYVIFSFNVAYSVPSLAGWPAGECDDAMTSWMNTFWVLSAWLLLAVISSFIESKTSNGSTSETMPLV